MMYKAKFEYMAHERYRVSYMTPEQLQTRLTKIKDPMKVQAFYDAVLEKIELLNQERESIQNQLLDLRVRPEHSQTYWFLNKRIESYQLLALLIQFRIEKEG